MEETGAWSAYCVLLDIFTEISMDILKSWRIRIVTSGFKGAARIRLLKAEILPCYRTFFQEGK